MSEQQTKETRVLQPTLVKILRNPKYAGTNNVDAYPGWIVPETDGLMAIDQRVEANVEFCEPAVWFITHLPTGASVRKGIYTDAGTRDEAIAIAQRFYQEAKARGWPLESTDVAAIPAAHNAMSDDEKRKFWQAVAGITL